MAKTSEIPDAIGQLRNLVNTQEQLWGPDHLKLTSTLTTLADLLIAQELYLDAEPILWRVLEIRHKASGQTNLEVSVTLLDLSILHEKQGFFGEAERLLRWALDIMRNLLGSAHPDYKEAHDHLQQLLSAQGKPLEEDSVDTPQTLPPPTMVPRADVFCWDHHYQRGTALLDAGESLSAEVLFDCLVTITEHFAPQTIHHARCLDNLGRARFQQGRYPESMEHFKEALTIFEKTVGPRHLDTVECLEAMADIHAASDELDEARSLFNWAQTIAKKEGHVEPFERIKCKLAALPFVSSKSTDAEFVEKVVAETKKKTSGIRKTTGSVTKPPVGLEALLSDLALPKRKTGTFIKPPLEEAETPLRKKTSSSMKKPIVVDSAKPGNVQAILNELQTDTKPSAAVRAKTTGSLKKPVLQKPVEEAPPPPPPTPTKKKTTTSTARPKLPEQPPQPPAADSAASRFDVPIQQRKPEAPDLSTKRKTTTTTNKPDSADLAALEEVNEESLAAERNLFGSMTDRPVLPVDIAPKKKTSSFVLRPHEETPEDDEPANPDSDAAEANLFGNVTDPSKPAPRLVSADPLKDSPKNPVPKPKLESQVMPPEKPSGARTTFKPWQKPNTSPVGRIVPGMEPEVAADPTLGGMHYMEIFEDKLSSFLFDKYKASGMRSLTSKDYPEAERMYLLALEKAEAFGHKDPRLWQTQCMLGTCYENLKKYSQAEELYKKSLGMAERTLGNKHPDIAKYLHYVAKLFATTERWSDAEQIYDQAIAILRQSGASFEEVSVMMRGLEHAQKRGKN